jgi:hypothetical protein
MTGKEESGIEPSYRIACSISPEKKSLSVAAELSQEFIHSQA